MPKKPADLPPQKPDDEARDAVLRRMLKTPPKPHKDNGKIAAVRRKKAH